jgi:DNA mismatch endonuclease, patch repair protein
MQSVRRQDTGPELRVRRAIHAQGLRYRLHRKDLPGTPDIVLPRWKTVIFVHGCFWHGHGCAKGKPPKSRQDYWNPKLDGNFSRDRTKKELLESLGWKVLVIWECETRDDPERLGTRIRLDVLGRSDREADT